MNYNANFIKNRLSLRPPQAESLEILTRIADELCLSKDTDVNGELEKIKSIYPTLKDFEREFPSVCFSLATGVGKTRLMGAFLVYLYKEKGIKNFFILAPNLTVYNKLIEDFSNPHSQKYVFKGISEFVSRPPKIITGDNYKWEFSSVERARDEGDVCINFFNISKINSESRGGKDPLIKRMSEYIGQSYFDYLVSLNDLVLMMDESHHYRADRGMAVLNELKPILGLELTATPQVEKSGGAIKFKNVVYEYSLAKAIADGFVKEPAVATRKDFDPTRFSKNPLELDQLKLEDGIRIHEKTKVELDIYSKDSGAFKVKPFVLVVAKDTEHAAQLKDIISSPNFFNGYYADKVMDIHSNQQGSEKEENIQKLLSVEDITNPVEIVIHVNMLKEGWDVTNLYTIIPLRTAASTTLREQTIGRGLRLPYGKLTGNSMVDKLTIVAHDKFEEIVKAANDPNSLIRKENIITIDDEEYLKPIESITIASYVQQAIQEKREAALAIEDDKVQAKELVKVDIQQKIVDVLPSTAVKSVMELSKPEVKAAVIKQIRQKAENSLQVNLFIDHDIEEVEKAFDEIVSKWQENIIEIPKITMVQSGSPKYGYKEFDLDVSSLNYQPVSEDIITQDLRTNKRETISGGSDYAYDKPENIIVNELIDHPQVDYDKDKELLYKLANQLISHFKSYLSEEHVMNVVRYNKKQIGLAIYTQMKEYFYLEPAEYEPPKVFPFDRIYPHNYTKFSGDKLYMYTETVSPREIPSKVFTGFMKSCHSEYKFDSGTEKDFAIVLENDADVVKWLRPSKEQFRIYWDRNSKRYEPDFVVETKDAIYMVETKKKSEIDSEDVQAKAKAALLYCKNASEFTTANGGKPWKYLLIPHDAVKTNMSFSKFTIENCLTMIK